MSREILTVAINDEIRGKVDLQRDKLSAHSLTYNYRVMALPLDEVVAHVAARHNIAAVCRNSAGVYHRKKENFKQADLFLIDQDNDGIERGEYQTFEDALVDPFISGNAAFLYTTPSHKPEHHKFRIAYWLYETITDRELFERIARAFIWKHRSDENCKDASRYFYGTGEGGRVELLGNRLSQSTVDGLLKEYADFVEANRPKVSGRALEHFTQSDFAPQSEEARRRAYGERAIRNAQQMIYNSRPPVGDIKGNRHHARVIAAYLLGGYVGGGLLSHYEARAALESAVRGNASNFTAAMQTVDDCLEAGKSEPITFEMKEAERQAYIGQRKTKVRVSPVLEPRRRPDNAITLEPPKRPANAVELPKPTRPAAAFLTMEGAR